MPFSLDELADAFGADPAEGRWFFDCRLKSLVCASQTGLQLAMAGRLKASDLPGAPPEMVTAFEIVSSEEGSFIPLPGQVDVIEWNAMRRFAELHAGSAIGTELSETLNGLNAFKLFAQKLRQHKLAGEWEKFRQEVMRSFALEWCQSHGLEEFLV